MGVQVDCFLDMKGQEFARQPAHLQLALVPGQEGLFCRLLNITGDKRPRRDIGNLSFHGASVREAEEDVGWADIFGEGVNVDSI